MRRLMTAAAAIALVAGSAYAQGNGKGGGQGGGHQAAEHGGKPDKASRGQGGGGGGMQAVSVPRDRGGSEDRGNTGRGPSVDNGSQARGNNDRGGNDNRDVVIDRNRGNGDRGVVVDRGRGNGGRAVIVDRGRDVDVVRVASFGAIPSRGVISGCPPGLAKKNPPCVPPGQVRSRFRSFDRPDFWGLRLSDGRYWYDDGYLVRLAPDGRIGGYIPLLGGALAIGNVWPSSYQPVALPTYYESYYGLGPHESYRYADNVIYQIDPETAAITSIAALLTGDSFVVGQPMPAGYDVYNVPYTYRGQYYDTPDALYRYSDGYVYQVDPETRLIAAAIELIAS